MSEKFQKFILSTVGVLAMSILVGYLVFAWNEPGCNPPNCNVSQPINVGPQGQAKQGGLILNTGGASTGLIVQYGNVGIGTTAPSFKLDVSGDVRWTGTLQGGSVPWARLTNFPSACPSGQFVTAVGTTLTCASPPSGGIGGSGTTNYIAKFTGSTTIGNSLIYDNGINVGIGTTAPSYKLTVSGGDIYGSNNLYIAGNVGIGTTAPSYKLHVQGGDIYSSGYVRGGTGLCIGSDCRTSWPSGGGGGIGGSGTTNYIAKFTGSTTIGNSIIYDNGTNVGIGTTAPSYKLTVSGGDIYGSNNLYIAGNVGIGTTAPSYKLHVQGGDIYSSGYVRGGTGLCIGSDCRTSWPSGGGGGIGGSGTTNYIAKFTGSTTIGNSIIYDNGTNVGIGTTAPSYKLTVSGGDIYGSNNLYIAGNVGIGTTAPVQKLDVRGNTYISGNVGIGTTAPQSKLSIGDSGSSTIAVYVNNFNTGSNFGIFSVSNGTGVYGAGTTYGVYGKSTNIGVYAVGLYAGVEAWGNSYGVIATGTYYDIVAENSNAKNYFAGAVGIGTWSPSYKLHVQGGDIYSSGYVRGGTGLCIGSDCRTSWPSGGGGGVSGSGSTNYVAKWTGSSSIGNSIIYDNGTNVGIGTTAPGYKLDVAGDIHISGQALVGLQIVANTCYDALECTVSCPAGKRVTGGGCQFSGYYLVASYPSSDTSWYCKITARANITVYAICARIAP
jgi:hypothetical protein